MLDFNQNKSFRVLRIYQMLSDGEHIKKNTLAEKFGVTTKTIQRDIDEIRLYLEHEDMQVSYNRLENAYFIQNNNRNGLTEEEKLVISKILLESRGLCKDELDVILDKLVSKDDKLIYDMILNEKFYYTEICHKQKLIDKIYDLSRNIAENEMLEIEYTKINAVETRKHQVKPVSIMFSEYYFYLITYMVDGTKDFPTVFRLDRIVTYKGLGEKFSIPYKDRFSEGEFRKRVPFMFTGELKIVNFLYKGASIEAVLDRLPTAQVISKEDDVYKIKAEVYGDGVFMWLKSQGENVEIL